MTGSEPAEASDGGSAGSVTSTPAVPSGVSTTRSISTRSGFFAVALTMAAGGLLSARKVAETMSRKIAVMNHGQGFSANLATGILVIIASLFGLPVSTTHVSVGALFGMGGVRRRKRRPAVHSYSI